VVPFGLTNEPVTFMCLMNNVLRNYLDKFLILFIDEILIYSKTGEEHEEHLRLVLQTPREHQLYAKFSKCEFYHDKVQYLRHVILGEGISFDPQNVKSIVVWPVAKDVSYV
jgi:hypothetical protein